MKGNDFPVEPTPVDSTDKPVTKSPQRYMSYRARQIRFWSFVAFAVLVAIVVGIGAYKYSEQESSLNQIDSFVSAEASQRSQISMALDAPDAQEYLRNIDTESAGWKKIFEARDAKRVEARQKSIDRFPSTGWFPDLNQRLEKVADKSFGTSEQVNESLKAHAVSIYVQGCSDLKADPAAGIEGALKKYDATSAEFYKEIEQTNLQEDYTNHFRTVLSDALHKGCPTVTPAVVDPMSPATK